MDTAIIVALITAVSSSGLSSLIVYMLQRRDKKNDKATQDEEARTKMLMGLAREIIVNRGEEYIKSGEIKRTEYNDLKKYLYEPYRALGGNGTAEKVMCEVENLKFIAE